MSRLDVLAGPNGAGRTTLYERVIRTGRPGLLFVDVDRIAAARFPGQEVVRCREAAEIVAATRRALLGAWLDFCAETVLS